MTDFDYYSIHDIVKIKTNRAVPIPEYFRLSSQNVNPGEFEADITVVEESLGITQPDTNKKRSGAFFYWTDEDGLFIEYEVPVLDAQMCLRDLPGDTEIRFSEAFVKHGDVIHLFEIILSIKFTQKGHAFVHTGCLNFNDNGVLIAALPDTGKTSTCLSLLNGEDIRFMSDDLAILSEDGTVYSYPRRVNISPYTLTGEVMERSDDLITRIKRQLANSRFEILFGTVFNISMGDRKYVPDQYIDDKSTVEQVYMISGGEEGIRAVVDPEEKARKVLINTLELFDPFKIYTLNFYYALFDFDVFEILDRQREIVEAAVEDADCYEVRSNVVERYPQLINNQLRGE
jgi:hypothetical protein